VNRHVTGVQTCALPIFVERKKENDIDAAKREKTAKPKIRPASADDNPTDEPSAIMQFINGVLGIKKAGAAGFPEGEKPTTVKNLKFSENGIPTLETGTQSVPIDKFSVARAPVAPMTALKITDPRKGFSKTITDPKKLEVARQIAQISDTVAPEYTNYLIRLAEYEGGLKTNARNDKNTNGGVDRGLFQINSKWFPQITDEQADDLQFATLWAISLIQAGKQHKWMADKLIKGKVKLTISQDQAPIAQRK
jgi:hypothetical protein